LKNSKRCFTTGIIAILSLLIGILIYVVYRPTSILAFEWFSWLGIDGLILSFRELTFIRDFTPYGFFLQSAPAGFWALSASLLMRIVWWHNKSLWGVFWFCLIPILGMVAELSQLIGLPGVFDPLDIFAYLVALIIAFFIISILEENETFIIHWPLHCVSNFSFRQ
jgi:hypothetical protein